MSGERIALAVALLLSASEAAVAAGQGQCGWYAILGCERSEAAMDEKRAILARLTDDGTTRAKVVRTEDFPNFRDGWFCLVDGPFETRAAASAVEFDWSETVGETYVKRAC